MASLGSSTESDRILTTGVDSEFPSHSDCISETQKSDINLCLCPLSRFCCRWVSAIRKLCGILSTTLIFNFSNMVNTRVGTLIVATIYLQLIQNRYVFRSFTVLQCSHQHCVQPVASDVEVVGYV